MIFASLLGADPVLLQLSGVIDDAQLSVMRQALRSAAFVDGQLSAGKQARRVKHNEELGGAAELAEQLGKIILGNLYNHAQFRHAALPLRTAAPIVARYTQGMAYGAHIDDPVMGEGQRLRSDIAVTVFLNHPQEYAGGELAVHTPFGEQRVKLAAGDAVLYPASSLHRVTEVSQGERLVAVTWVQSLVRDPQRRQILYDLSQARERLLEQAVDDVATTQVDHAYTNLVRMWSEV